MAQRVIRISELANTPATEDKPAKVGMLGVSPATIWRWVREGRFPQPFKLGPATTVWDADEVEAFLAQHRDNRTGSAHRVVGQGISPAQQAAQAL